MNPYYYISGYVQMVPATPGTWPPPRPTHPIMLPGMPGWGGGGPSYPVDPGYSPPWAQVPGGGGPGGPVDPGYSPPWAQPSPPRPTHPIMLPGMPGWGSGGPVDPGYSPPWARPNPPGPVDPGYGNPWFDPHPSHPIMLPGYPGWGGGGPVDPGYSPPWAQVPGQPPQPPGWGPGGPPHPAFPIWGGPGAGFPDKPGYPPVIGGGPIIPPTPIFTPIPPNMQPPPSEPTELPDLNSPGFWCFITGLDSGKPTLGFIQILIDTSPGHVPKLPETGLPGAWVDVYGGIPPTVRDAWVPTPPSTTSPDDPYVDPRKEKKHSKS